MKELVNINKDILNKIDSFDMSEDKKDFLKKLLLEEFLNRDKSYVPNSNQKNNRYEPLIDEYYLR